MYHFRSPKTTKSCRQDSEMAANPYNHKPSSTLEVLHGSRLNVRHCVLGQVDWMWAHEKGSANRDHGSCWLMAPAARGLIELLDLPAAPGSARQPPADIL
jgi:hypothetical protein